MPESPGTRRDSRLRNGKVQNRTGGRRSRRQQDVYLGPKDLDEKVAELKFPSLGAELTVLPQLTPASRSKTLSRGALPLRCKVQPRVLCTRGDDHRLYALSPSVVMVLVCSLLKVDLSPPGNRDLRRVSRRQPLRASRLRWTSPFHLTGNFNILTLDLFQTSNFGLRHWPSVLRDVVYLHGPSAGAASFVVEIC